MLIIEIQNGLVSQTGSNKLLNSTNIEDTNKLEETKELYNSKYHGYIKKEAEKISIFRHLNVEKTTKWFLNLTSER